MIFSHGRPEYRYQAYDFSSPEPKCIGWDSSRRPSVRPSTLSNIYISETNGPIAIKLHQKHNCDEGLPALEFEADRISTLVAMATY